MGTGPPSIDTVPLVPNDPQELEGWLSDRNCDLRNAIEFGTEVRGTNWTSHWTGRETVGEITRPVQCAHEWSGEIFHDGSTDRSSRRQEEVRRVHTVGRESGVRDARYGLRGVRVGEASHPDPQGRRTRDIPDEVLDNLRELRLMESDDEPLVRSSEGRNVVPRISSLEATEASERRRSDVHSFVHDEGVPSVMPTFRQTAFGQNHIWPKNQNLANLFS